MFRRLVGSSVFPPTATKAQGLQIRSLFSKKRGQKNLAAATAGAEVVEQGYHFENVTREMSAPDGLFDMDAVLDAAAAREPAAPSTPAPPQSGTSSNRDGPQGGTINFKPPAVFVAKRKVGKDEAEINDSPTSPTAASEPVNLPPAADGLPEVSYFQNMKLTPQEEIVLLRQLLAMRSDQAKSASVDTAPVQSPLPMETKEEVKNEVKKESKVEQKLRLAEEKRQEKVKKVEETRQAERDGELWGREVVSLIQDQLVKEISATLPRAENHSLFEKRVWAVVTAIPPGRVTTLASIVAIVRAREALDGEWPHDEVLVKLKDAASAASAKSAASASQSNSTTSAATEEDPLQELKNLSFLTPSNPEEALAYIRASGLVKASVSDVVKVVYKCPVQIDTYRIIKGTGHLYAPTDKARNFLANKLEQEGVIVNTGGRGAIQVDPRSIWAPHVDFEQRRQKLAEATTIAK